MCSNEERLVLITFIIFSKCFANFFNIVYPAGPKWHLFCLGILIVYTLACSWHFPKKHQTTNIVGGGWYTQENTVNGIRQ